MHQNIEIDPSTTVSMLVDDMEGYPSMSSRIDLVPSLDYDMRERIWTLYRDGVRARMMGLRYDIEVLFPDRFDVVLDWMAHMLQYPYQKPTQGFLLVGPHGCGKTLFGTLLTLLLGPNNVKTTTQRLTRRFLDVIPGALLLHCDDCDFHREKACLRTILANDFIESHRRFQEVTRTASYHRLLVTSSNMQLTPLDATRHFNMIRCGTTVRGSEFHRRMHDPEQLALLRSHLMRRQVTRI